MQGICKNNYMKLSDIYFNQNHGIYEMDSQRRYYCAHKLWYYYLLMTSSTQLEECMHYK